MHKSDTFIVEQFPSLRTSDLKEWDTISNICVLGKNNSLLPYRVRYELTKDGLFLDYYIHGIPKEQFIEIIFETSNLGIGETWYFLCPVTNKKCRKLVLSQGKFIHQSTIKGIHYIQQTESTPKRKSMKWIRRYKKYQELEKRQRQKYYKPTYGGNLSRLAIRATQALHRYASAMQNEKEVWAWFHQKSDLQE
ncbi:hypothetical protein [Algoriphagus machipongonensis]|uniref:Uncharacterized protein n=1 Tax=Algoriphagus machipongonensis TaxID=388413 RepID=A3HT78_9BACT|nr:hypothetical protein [Algoriphagus machipongonensis]EAZ83046.1 hypothetical protein ALPR1_12535 [Algoriphagus machipongonensis]